MPPDCDLCAASSKDRRPIAAFCIPEIGSASMVACSACSKQRWHGTCVRRALSDARDMYGAQCIELACGACNKTTRVSARRETSCLCWPVHRLWDALWCKNPMNPSLFRIRHPNATVSLATCALLWITFWVVVGVPCGISAIGVAEAYSAAIAANESVHLGASLGNELLYATSMLRAADMDDAATRIGDLQGLSYRMHAEQRSERQTSPMQVLYTRALMWLVLAYIIISAHLYLAYVAYDACRRVYVTARRIVGRPVPPDSPFDTVRAR